MTAGCADVSQRQPAARSPCASPCCWQTPGTWLLPPRPFPTSALWPLPAPARGAALQRAVPSLTMLGFTPHLCVPSIRCPWLRCHGGGCRQPEASPPPGAAAPLCRRCSSFVQMQHERSSKCQPAPLQSLISKRNALSSVLLSIGDEDPLFRRFLIWKVNKCTA